MPVTPTYPGVYIEEIPSGVRTITGVATSITAFIGRARFGPENEAITINSFADFERQFGGLWSLSRLGYAVRDFYLNGGSRAIVVRLQRNATAATLSLPGGLDLEAASPGTWGDGLRARVDHDVSSDVATSYGLAATDLFNLTVRLTLRDEASGNEQHQVEQFRNVSVEDSPRRVDKVLEQSSAFVRVDDALPDARPDAHADPQAGEELWGDNDPATNTEAGGAGHDGDALNSNSFTGTGYQDEKKGLYALEDADLFNLLCLPPYTVAEGVDTTVIAAAASYCEERRALLIVDAPVGWTTKKKAVDGIAAEVDEVGTRSKNSALFFPRLSQPDPLKDNQYGTFAPCGAVAGVFARTDTQRGVWKAPAGLDATLVGVPKLSVALTDDENGELNPLGINCLRTRPAAGRVIWGSRTLQGDDRLASEWKYVPVRRTALFLEESLYRGTQWVVFEPNDEPLWAQIRLNIGAFMHNLFRQGAFQGTTPQEAYFVKCDKETTTQNDINLGIVNIVVGFAPLKPAEFVIIKIQQMAGQVES